MRASSRATTAQFPRCPPHSKTPHLLSPTSPPLHRSEEALAELPKPPLWTYLVLSTCDLTASTISGIGQIWVSASALQMLRGSSVLFTGLCSVCGDGPLFILFRIILVSCLSQCPARGVL
jgi:hypothetical protein